jgi:hypothetical protein
MLDERTSGGTWLLLAAIVGMGAALRFAGVTFGLEDTRSFLIHPDELGVAHALRDLGPGRTTFFLVIYGGGLYLPLAAFAHALAAIGGPDPWNAATALDAVLAARLWSASLSSATIVVVFATARRVRSASCGLAAAFLLAASLLAVRDAHIGKADSAAAFAAALALLAMVHADARRWISFALLGAAAGLTLSTKYGVGSLPAIGLMALALLWRCDDARERARALAAFAIAAATTTSALSFFWLLHPGQSVTFFRQLLSVQMEYAKAPYFEGLVPDPLQHHLSISLRHGCGLAFALLTLPALAYGLGRRGGSRWIALAVIGQFFVLLSNPLVLARNLEPLVPGLCVLVAVLLADVSARLGATPRAQHVCLVLATLVVALSPLRDAVGLARVLRVPDTRTLASDWMAANLPAADAVRCVMPPAAPMSCPEPRRLRLDPGAARGERYAVHASYPPPFLESPPPPSGQLLATFDPFPDRDAHPIVERLDLFLLPFAGFAGVTHPGPKIDIYRIDAPPPSDPPTASSASPAG